jgi:hypothetical protein
MWAALAITAGAVPFGGEDDGMSLTFTIAALIVLSRAVAYTLWLRSLRNLHAMKTERDRLWDEFNESAAVLAALRADLETQ